MIMDTLENYLAWRKTYHCDGKFTESVIQELWFRAMREIKELGDCVTPMIKCLMTPKGAEINA